MIFSFAENHRSGLADQFNVGGDFDIGGTGPKRILTFLLIVVVVTTRDGDIIVHQLEGILNGWNSRRDGRTHQLGIVIQRLGRLGRFEWIDAAVR